MKRDTPSSFRDKTAHVEMKKREVVYGPTAAHGIDLPCDQAARDEGRTKIAATSWTRLSHPRLLGNTIPVAGNLPYYALTLKLAKTRVFHPPPPFSFSVKLTFLS